jgi:hypothetical protein
MDFAAIPTEYNGGQYRSRLEARWAAFFDLVGWRYTYEPFDADGYIPDFLIHGRFPFLVEVGPCITEQDYMDKTEKPRRLLEHVTLVVGVSPFADLHTNSGYRSDYPGLIVNEFGDGRAYPAHWHETMQVYGDGSHHYPDYEGTDLACSTRETDAQIERWWREAGSMTQWFPKVPRA